MPLPLLTMTGSRFLDRSIDRLARSARGDEMTQTEMDMHGDFRSGHFKRQQSGESTHAALNFYVHASALRYIGGYRCR